MKYNNLHELSLLSKTELEWLLGNKQLSKSFEYKIKSTIKKKIDKLLNFELPLLIQNGILNKQLIQNIIDNPNNMLPILGKEKVAGPKVWNHTGIPAQGSESCYYHHEFHYHYDCMQAKVLLILIINTQQSKYTQIKKTILSK